MLKHLLKVILEGHNPIDVAEKAALPNLFG
mgnify:FL=1